MRYEFEKWRRPLYRTTTIFTYCVKMFQEKDTEVHFWLNGLSLIKELTME
jgi:hypothetical protein